MGSVLPPSAALTAAALPVATFTTALAAAAAAGSADAAITADAAGATRATSSTDAAITADVAATGAADAASSSDAAVAADAAADAAATAALATDAPALSAALSTAAEAVDVAATTAATTRPRNVGYCRMGIRGRYGRRCPNTRAVAGDGTAGRVGRRARAARGLTIRRNAARATGVRPQSGRQCCRYSRVELKIESVSGLVTRTSNQPEQKITCVH